MKLTLGFFCQYKTMISRARFKKSVLILEGLIFLTLASFQITPSGGNKIKYFLSIPSSIILAIVL